MPKRQHKPIPQMNEKQVARFWEKIERRGPDECWPWMGCKTDSNYGVVGFNRFGAFRCTRIMMALTTGEDPGHLELLHHCDNPPCCNPNHLFLGDQRDNVRDAIQKGRTQTSEEMSKSRIGRMPTGTKHHAAKLTDNIVRDMRQHFKQFPKSSIRSAAKDIGVSFHTLWCALNGETWKHVV